MSSNRIDDIFAQARADGRTLLMPFITAGYPNIGAMPALISALEKAGASICEIGFPFSDPIADGPVIAASMHEALAQAGVTVEQVFEAIGRVRPATRMGLVAMVSFSIVHRFGIERFLNRCAQCGVDGLIVPDLPLEESQEVRTACAARQLACALLIAPTTDEARAIGIARACSGFIYLLARTGITGDEAGGGTPANLEARIALIRDPSRGNCRTPIACGFGIASASDVAEVTRRADAAIVGSAIVRRITQHRNDPVEVIAHLIVSPFVEELVTGLARRQG